jgi:pyridoxal phosphate enzyme (YggS family)
VDRLSIAQRLNDQRPEGLPPLRITVQVNISDEASKSGVLPKDLPALAESIAQLPRLEFRGLMAIPAPSTDPEVQRSAFRQLRLALEALEMPGATDLSMGMSEDLEAAILEGATLVRIGTAVFGRRPAL